MPKRGQNVRKRKDGRWEGRYSVKDIYYGTTQVRGKKTESIPHVFSIICLFMAMYR